MFQYANVDVGLDPGVCDISVQGAEILQWEISVRNSLLSVLIVSMCIGSGNETHYVSDKGQKNCSESECHLHFGTTKT